MSQTIALDSTPFPSEGRSAAAAATLANGSEFLAFKLGNEEYGLDLMRVQEIRSYEEPTRIANAPAGVLGVLDLRGVIVPVLDLRQHLGFTEARCDSNTVVIVLAITGRVVGVVVDGVSDVMALSPQQLRPAPEFSARLERRHVLALGAVDQRMLILVDIDALLGEPSLGLLTV